jgi:hypothetical protein
VRDLYKQFILAGKYYPQGLSYVKVRVKKGFYENEFLEDEKSIKAAVLKGRYFLKELIAFSKLHKYRAMKIRYGK